MHFSDVTLPPPHNKPNKMRNLLHKNNELGTCNVAEDTEFNTIHHNAVVQGAVNTNEVTGSANKIQPEESICSNPRHQNPCTCKWNQSSVYWRTNIVTDSMERNPSWEAEAQSRNSPPFIELERSLPCSYQPITCHYPEATATSPHLRSPFP